MKKIGLLGLALCLLITACAGCKQADAKTNPAQAQQMVESAAPVPTRTPEATPAPTPAVSATPDPTESRPGYYYNQQYGFSLSYPSEWAAGEESASGDGLVLNEKDGNDIRVYGGYLVDDLSDKYIKEAKKKRLQVSKLMTDFAETGVLIEGAQEGKRLFHFIIAGKEKHAELYALVSEVYYNQNKEVLLECARHLLLGEIPKFSEAANEDELSNYEKYLSLLSLKHIRHIGLAEAKYLAYATQDKAANDKLFRLFRKFYEEVWGNNNQYFNEGGIEFAEEIILPFGMRRNFSEAGDYLSEYPDYLPSHFSATLTDGLQEFLRIRKKEYDQNGATYLTEEAVLQISWDELGDRIIDWENYKNKYPDYEESRYAQEEIDWDLYLYLLNFDLAWDCEDDDHASIELQKSYERFIAQYPNSKYYEVVKGYYDILAQNKFKRTKKAAQFLKEHGIANW